MRVCQFSMITVDEMCDGDEIMIDFEQPEPSSIHSSSPLSAPSPDSLASTMSDVYNNDMESMGEDHELLDSLHRTRDMSPPPVLSHRLLSLGVVSVLIEDVGRSAEDVRFDSSEEDMPEAVIDNLPLDCVVSPPCPPLCSSSAAYHPSS